MSALIYLFVYLAIAVFLTSVLSRIVSYIRNPIHLRWELYPVAHEGGEKASYGGSYLEDVDWWNKPRHSSKINELKVMIPEILFLMAVFEHKRALWYVTYPFHLGLYLLSLFIGLLGISSISQITGILANTSIISTINVIALYVGPAGLILTAAGAIGLLFKRITDHDLRNYSSFEHYFNLILFISCAALGFASWHLVDPTFSMTRTFIANLLTFNFAEINSALFITQVIIVVLTITYIPFTHMSHFFMKYFLYHDIRWGDTPNIDSPEIERKIGIVLNYPVTWSAPHISGTGNSWAEVAMHNPAAEDEETK